MADTGFKMPEGKTHTPLAPDRPPPVLNNVRAAVILIVAMLCFTIETMAVRALSGSANAAQAVLFRAIGQMVLIAVWMLARNQRPRLASPRLGLHIARGIVSVCAWWLYYRMFQRLDFALATLLTFASSLFVVILARPILGEKVHLVSWAATLIGFGGIALATGVGSVPLSVDVYLGLLAAALSASIVFLTRSLTQSDDTLTIMTFIGLIVLVVAVPVAALDWQPLSLAEMGWLMASSLLGAFGMMLMIEAYAIGQAAVLAPIGYLRIAFAIGIGAVVWSEIPSWRMLAGTAIVIVSAVYAMGYERRLKQRLIGAGGIGAGPVR